MIVTLIVSEVLLSSSCRARRPYDGFRARLLGRRCFAALSGGSHRMRFVIGLLVSFGVGVGCRYFDIPVGSPAVIPGALLVVAMTIGYSSTNALLNRRNNLATTGHLCGGPSVHWPFPRGPMSPTPGKPSWEDRTAARNP